MKYLIFLILSIFLLTSCTDSGVSGESPDGTMTVFEGEGFSTFVPKNWQEVESTKLPIPNKGSVVAAFISPSVKYGFSHNYLIIKEGISSPITSRKYSELNHIQTTKNYLEYTKLQEIPISFADTDVSLMYVFEARYNKTTPRMQFIQTAKICGTTVYLLHASMNLGQKIESYQSLFSSFTCK